MSVSVGVGETGQIPAKPSTWSTERRSDGDLLVGRPALRWRPTPPSRPITTAGAPPSHCAKALRSPARAPLRCICIAFCCRCDWLRAPAGAGAELTASFDFPSSLVTPPTTTAHHGHPSRQHHRQPDIFAPILSRLLRRHCREHYHRRQPWPPYRSCKGLSWPCLFLLFACTTLKPLLPHLAKLPGYRIFLSLRSPERNPKRAVSLRALSIPLI